MLPERYRELLTAYVDGELSARQRRHALRLLRRSAEARRLLERLQTDSRDLIALPKPPLDCDLSGPVLEKIAAVRPLPFRPVRRLAAPRIYPMWVGAAAAAAVLFVIGAASYFFFASFDHRPTAPIAAVQNPVTSRPDVKPPLDPPHEAPPPNPDGGNNAVPPPHPPEEDVAHQKPADPNPAPLPEKDEPVYTSEGMELFVELKNILPAVDVPSTFKLHDLGDDAAHKKLVAELQKDAAFRLELPILDGNRAFERLQIVLKAHHVDLLIDATAQRRLAKPPPLRTNYVLYTEDLTADDLGQVLKQVGAEDRKAAEKKPADGRFDALVLHRMTDKDHKELADLMGVDPTPLAPPKDVGPLGVDPRKPVSDLTGPQIAASLAPGKPGAKPATEHPMLVLPYNPVRPRRDSAEVKRFLEERKPLRPGALQILLVLRGPTK